MRRQPGWSSLVLLLPMIGNILFLLLYGVATQLYPGGSQADPLAVGFSWRHNYWCNLLNDQAMNGLTCLTLALYQKQRSAPISNQMGS